MSAPALSGPPPPTRRPIDPRLWRASAPVRRYVVGSVGIGLALTAGLVVQAVLLADVLARAMARDVSLEQLVGLLVVLAAVLVVRSLLLGLSTVLASAAASRVKAALRHDALARLLELGPSWIAQQEVGELATTVGRGLDALDVYLGSYLPGLVLAVLAPLVLLAAIARMDLLSAGILIVSLSTVPVFMVLIGKLTETRVAARWRALGRLGAHFLDVLEGLVTLRAFGRAARQASQIGEVSEELRRTTLGILRETFLSALVLETIAAIGTALVAVPLGLRLIDHTIALAPALAILILTPEVFLPLRKASADFHAAAEGLSATDRIFSILEAPGRTRSEDHGEACPPKLRRQDEPGSVLSVRGLTLWRPGHDHPVLQSVDVELTAGERIGLVGPTGAGKSSLLAALLGFAPRDSGTFEIGQTRAPLELDCSDEVQWASWRTHFTYLPQFPRLFPGSIAANLRVADEGASDSELFEALSVVGLADKVAASRHGLLTELGEAGGGLSAGERQRLALARALLRPAAEIVLLDEPTSHLDATSEARLVPALSAALKGRSCILATHRPQPLALVDRVIICRESALVPASSEWCHKLGVARLRTTPSRSGEVR